MNVNIEYMHNKPPNEVNGINATTALLLHLRQITLHMVSVICSNGSSPKYQAETFI